MVFFFSMYYSPVYANKKDEIILRLKKTNNLSFDFKQTIKQKTEKGNCIIKFPKKIFCSYNNVNKKIMVSNGKYLVIKNEREILYNLYRLEGTPLEIILDKNYLIQQFKNIKPRVIDNTYTSFLLNSKNYTINIFFDNKSLDLIGWQTEDIYQNLVITFISNVKINEKINDKKFKLPNN